MFREKKRRIKLPLRAYLLYFTLLSFLLTGVTFSKYVTRSTGGDSARVVRFGNLQIKEDASSNVFVPGVSTPKDTYVYIEPTEVDVYVFLTVSVTGFATNDYCNFYLFDNKIHWSVDTATWTALPNNTLVFYYRQDTNASAIKKYIFTGKAISVSSAVTESDLLNLGSPGITFKAYMVQAGGFATAEEAWAAIPH